MKRDGCGKRTVALGPVDADRQIGRRAGDKAVHHLGDRLAGASELRQSKGPARASAFRNGRLAERLAAHGGHDGEDLLDLGIDAHCRAFGVGVDLRELSFPGQRDSDDYSQPRRQLLPVDIEPRRDVGTSQEPEPIRTDLPASATSCFSRDGRLRTIRAHAIESAASTAQGRRSGAWRFDRAAAWRLRGPSRVRVGR
jgi:hypothetical protein